MSLFFVVFAHFTAWQYASTGPLTRAVPMAPKSTGQFRQYLLVRVAALSFSGVVLANWVKSDRKCPGKQSLVKSDPVSTTVLLIYKDDVPPSLVGFPWFSYEFLIKYLGMNIPIYWHMPMFAPGFFAAHFRHSCEAMAATAFREAVEAEEEAAQDAVPLLSLPADARGRELAG